MWTQPNSLNWHLDQISISHIVMLMDVIIMVLLGLR